MQEPPRYANAMIHSIVRYMPEVDIVQLTDDDTPQVPMVREAIRLKNTFANPMIFRMHHLSRLSGDVLCLDTDVMVQADLSPIFQFDFDVALTQRHHKVVDPDGNDISKLMPYNTGVTFTKNRLFWKEAVDAVKDCGFGWYSDQIVVAKLAKYFKVLKLDCDNFNHKPRSAEEDVSGRYAVHYRGKARKYLDAIIDKGDL